MTRYVPSRGIVIREVRILKGNRITIPVDVRRALGLKPGDKLRVTPRRYAVTFDHVERTKRRSVSTKSRT